MLKKEVIGMQHINMDRNQEITWISGLLEGEGCFDLAKNKYSRVRLYMTDKDIVKRYVNICNKNNINTPSIKTQIRNNRKDIYGLTIYGNNAQILMNLVLPFMGKRRSQKIKELIT